MNKLSKILITVALCALTLLAAGCGDDSKEAKKADPSAPVKIGVTAGPHAEIMDNVKKLAEKDGLKIEVVEFSDFVSPNVALSQNELFANSMQHAPYLAATLKKEPKFELVEVFKTVNFPMAIYSSKYKKVEDIPAGAIIGIPNDPSNGARALLMLADKSFIELKDKNSVTATVADITKNEKNYQIRELDAASIPKAMPDLDIAVINANYALVANLNPTKDSLLIERPDNPFLNIFVTTKANAGDPRIAQLKKIYQSAENKKFIEDHFKGTITTGF
ncbi:MAG: MetQ/NlpA family ABC transporter substrate-binding protein [Phascolarctobacterium sp.]|uniref:MetQ/NlpA family ABC transporter substrate-binding protein n=1 Tax=Phascolarctobacterium sp. TaxID=2049039 RepID=UPI0026DBEB01|nr:MetQ/NlpA family ABC transporter substrate-binding protein [Phascolarctobacterium sp.]MDO4921420.1 MetQ/NlpA family ABC transporter substrate-binding protein [Phascolarctobacterium sp.]